MRLLRFLAAELCKMNLLTLLTLALLLRFPAAGESISEGGFAANRVSAASLLDVSEDTDKKGKKYYKYELLVRSGERTEQQRC
jgi:hypothetical protein